MLWLEIFGAVILYLLIGIPAVRLIYMMTDGDNEVKEWRGLFLVFWPAAIIIFSICIGASKLASLAFKWGPK